MPTPRPMLGRSGLTNVASVKYHQTKVGGSPTWEAEAAEVLVRFTYERHGRALLAYATRLADDQVAAEHAVQQTLAHACGQPEVLLGSKGSVRGRLFKTLQDIISDQAPAAEAAQPLTNPGTGYPDSVMSPVTLPAA